MPDVYQQSLAYHRKKPYGKLAIVPTKPMRERHDLALAYSPGVAEPCRAIVKNPLEAAELTARSNLIAVISNGTAVLGLGNIGALASKPVMEGKAVLFKKFAGVDAFDIEIDETDPDKLIEIIASLEPTFGGINLEDIKAPECFYIERKLKERLNIPVFHDDQHGTSIIVGAAVLNALHLVGKKIESVKLAVSGAGAGALACLDLLVQLGLRKENITVCDSKGVLSTRRTDTLDDCKRQYVRETKANTLADAMVGADIFLGLSVAGVVTQDMVKSMAEKPIILALANPEPEILPPLVKEARPDAIIATGRSDYPNQVNNALCFPYIFRGALDVGATTINEAMKIACVKAIAELTRAEASDVVSGAYGGEVHTFGPDFIIPKPFDPRLYLELAHVVAEAAMETGVATRPIHDMKAYREQLMHFIYETSLTMKPVFDLAKRPTEKPVRVAFSEGEDERVLQAVQTLVDDNVGRAILIGRPDIISRRIEKLGLRIISGKDFDVVDPNDDPRYHAYWTAYLSLMERRGVSPDMAKTIVRTDTTVIGALLVHLGDADALICGTHGRYVDHFRKVRTILGVDERHDLCAALCALIRDEGPLFFCDPYVNADPSELDLVEMVKLSVEQMRRFGVEPKVAFVSHSSFGTSRLESATKMQRAIAWLREEMPDLAVEGEMHAHAALLPEVRQRNFVNGSFQGPANLLIFPNIESANIAYHMAHAMTDAETVGPILMGCKESAHIMTSSTTVRSIVNMAALAIVDVQERLYFKHQDNVIQLKA